MTTKSKNILLSAVCAIGVTATAAGVAYASGKTANAESSAITGATLTLGSSISLRYYANASESGDIGTLTMRFTQNGKQSEPVQAQASGENRVYFDYEVAPQFMGDTVTAQLFGGETMLGVKEYSVAEYCKAKIADENADVDLKTLCADILAYGAASQMYTEHNTESLVNAGYGDSATEFEEIEDTDYSLTGEIDEKTAFTAGNCYFDGTNRILFYFNTDDFAALTIALKKDGKSIEYDTRCETEGKYVISADVYALDFNAVYTASITKGEAVQTAMYSLKSYAYYWQNNMAEDGETFSPMANLARALWNYGESSKAWYYTPVISETEETVTVKAGEAYQFPQLTATNRAGETLAVKPCVNGEETESDSAVFYEDGTIRYVAESHGQIATVDVNVNVDYEGVNLADAHYLDTAADRFYGIYGATFYGSVGGTQHIGRFTGKQIHDERVDVGVYGTSFVGSMSFNLRGGSETEKGLYVKVENSGGGRIQLFKAGTMLMSTDGDNATLPEEKRNLDPTLQQSWKLTMQVTDVKDESGNITALKVKILLNGESMTGDNDFEVAVSETERQSFAQGWFFIEGGANTSWMKANLYIHSIYLNTPEYPVNLLLSGWNYKNSSSIVTGASNKNGMQYAAVTSGNNGNTYTGNTRNYTDYGMYDGKKVKDQKVKITAKAAFESGDDFCVYFRENDYQNNGWRWERRGLFVSFSANDGVRICLGEAAFSYGNETKVYIQYTNNDIKAVCGGKTLSELFAAGVTLEMQAIDVTDEDGDITAVNIRIWINGIAINGEGYKAEKLNFSAGGVTGDCIFNAGYLMLGGAISDTEGYISGVYLED